MFSIKRNFIEQAYKAESTETAVHGLAVYSNGPLMIRADAAPSGSIRAAALVKQSDGTWFTKGPVGLLARKNKFYCRLAEMAGEDDWPYEPEKYYYLLKESDESNFEVLKADIYKFLNAVWDDAFKILFTTVSIYKDTVSNTVEDDNLQTVFVDRMALLDYFEDDYFGGYGKCGLDEWMKTFTADDLVSFPQFVKLNGDVLYVPGDIDFCQSVFPEYRDIVMM